MSDKKPGYTLVSYDDELKKLYPRPGQPMSSEGEALWAKYKAERAERNKDIAALIDEQGHPTVAGMERLWNLGELLIEVRNGHNDNTGMPCRIDLDGHDCCSTCNAAEDMLRATAKYYEDGERPTDNGVLCTDWAKP